MSSRKRNIMKIMYKGNLIRRSDNLGNLAIQLHKLEVKGFDRFILFKGYVFKNPQILNGVLNRILLDRDFIKIHGKGG